MLHLVAAHTGPRADEAERQGQGLGLEGDGTGPRRGGVKAGPRSGRGAESQLDRDRGRLPGPEAVTQTLEGSFSALSKPIFATEYSFAALFEIYTICMLLHRSKPKC